MDPDQLVRMANDIAAFFAADPDPDAAAVAVADHLRRFWEPRMRRELVAHLRETGGAGLSTTARRGVTRLGEAPSQA